MNMEPERLRGMQGAPWHVQRPLQILQGLKVERIERATKDALGHLWVFGGHDGSKLFDDLWYWDLQAWLADSCPRSKK